MKFIRRAGLGLVGALIVGAAGCAGTADDPALVLASAGDAAAEETVHFEMTMGDMMSMTGAADPASEAVEISMHGGMDGMDTAIEIIVIGTDMWMNMGDLGALLGFDTPWMLIDVSQLGDGGLNGFDPASGDPVGATQMLQSIGDVERVDDQTFEGTIDLTAVDSPMLDEDMIRMMGEEVGEMSFTATIDNQDRLSTLSITMPEIQGIELDTMEMRFFDYGTPVEITPPPADQVTEAPAEIYQMFGG